MSILGYTLPIVITSFNRPHYLKECIASIEKQTDLEDVEFILAQDGAYNPNSQKKKAEQADIDECIRIFEASNLPNKTIIESKYNVGIALNHAKGYRECFERRCRKAMILTEDDLVYNEDWLRITKVLLRQFEDDKRIATVQASCLGGWILDEEKRIEYQKTTAIGKPNWLGFGIWQDRWFRMKGFFDEYLNVVKDFDYHLRNHEVIKEWWNSKGIPEQVTSQDRVKEWSCILAGMCRVFTPANRAVYIGERGVHGSPANFKQAGFDRLVGTRIPGDDVLEEFDQPYNYTPEEFIKISLDQCQLIEPPTLGD